MDSYIKWESCERWDEGVDPVTKKAFKHHITRELVCSHPRVEKAWFVGYLTNKEPSEARIRLEILLKNESREDMLCPDDHKSFKVSMDEYESGNVPEAEEYLQSLPKEVQP